MQWLLRAHRNASWSEFDQIQWRDNGIMGRVPEGKKRSKLGEGLKKVGK